jgi:ribonuclease VapC
VTAILIVDASALLAIILKEPERDGFTSIIAAASEPAMSPMNYWEVMTCSYGLAGLPKQREAERLFGVLGISIAPIDARVTQIAVAAMARFGKHTPAKLNLGDCFAYALAKSLNAPLLFKGDDFRQTDVVAYAS